jgi:regulator of RNase E activity RraB
MNEPSIKDRLAELKSAGFDFSLPARIEHFVLASGDDEGREAIEGFAEEAQEQGFDVSDLVFTDPKEDWEDYDPKQDAEEQPYYALLITSPAQIVDEKIVAGECEMMAQLAEELGIEYDGWEIEGTNEDEDD